MAKAPSRIKVLVPVSGLVDKLGKPNTHVEVAVSYNAGGINYFNYKTEARGYYAHVTPVEVKDGFVSRMLGTAGFKVLLKPVPRQSAKAIEGVWAKVKPLVGDIAKAIEAGDEAEAAALLLALKEAA